MKKFATVFPTRIVHRKFSGFSKYSCSTLAARRPARSCRRIRNRLRAKTPASIPERRKDNARHAVKSTQTKVPVFMAAWSSLHHFHQDFPHAPFIGGVRRQFQAAKNRGVTRR